MRKRILSFILTLCMVMALMPATVQVSAAGHENHCICGANHANIGDHSAVDKPASGWTAWDNASALPDTSGYYYLTTDVTFSPGSRGWIWRDGTVLCLNGHTITGNGCVIEVGDYFAGNPVDFTLTDCAPGDNPGKIVSTGGMGAVIVNPNSNFTMYGGSIANGSSNDGGMVDVKGTFTMNGGSISNNERRTAGEHDSSAVRVCSNGSGEGPGKFVMNDGIISNNVFASDGSGVLVNSGATFIMNGGSITGNQAIKGGFEGYGIGGGVASKSGKVYLKGGEITGNSAEDKGGGVYIYYGTCEVSGNVVIKNNKKVTTGSETDNNVYLEGRKITISSPLTTGASIGITTHNAPTTGNPVDVTVGADADYSRYFFSDSADYEIYNDNNTIKLKQKDPTISSVDVTLTKPTPKDALASRATVSGTGVATTNPTITWKKGSETTTEIARYNTVYTANVTLSAESGYAFDSNVTANIKATDGSTIGSGTVTDNGDGTITVSYTFAATPKANIKNIAKPKDITGVANGTKKTAQALGLPSTVTIGTEDENKIASVTWDLVNLAEGTYDPAVKNEQSFKVNGTVTLPDDVANGNNISLKVTVGVTVKAAEVTTVPETLSFGYAYDVQKELVYPKGTGSTMDFSDMEKPLAENGSRKDNYAGEWTLAKAGTYSYLKMYMEKSKMDITNLESVVTKVVTEYGWTEEQKNGCVIYELKDGEKHVAYGILLAYDTEKERAVFVGDNLSGGVGYLLTKRELHVSPGILGYTIAVTKSVKDFAEKSEYQMLEGTDGKWEQNSEETLSFRVDCDFNKFIGVMVDNKLVDAKNYTAKSGSTIVTLKGDFLKSLSAGSHKMTTVFTDGECTTVFEVKEVAEEGKNNPTETTKPENGKNETTGTSDSGNGKNQSTNTSTSGDSKGDTSGSTASANNSTPTAEKSTTENGTGNKTDAPKTGDSTDMVWLMIMVGFSGMGLILAAKKGRRNLKGLR